MRALVLVDIQNDFLSGGALAVPHGDDVISVANKLRDVFKLIVATKDWHPANHGSFARNHPGKKVGDVIELNGLQQILWPVHCVQGETGAEFPPSLVQPPKFFVKGADPGVDSYSGFFDNGHRHATGLGDFLRNSHVTDVYIMGLATDYCVKFTALDAVAEGFTTYLIEDGCRGVNLHPGDVDRAIAEMKDACVRMVSSSDLLAGDTKKK